MNHKEFISQVERLFPESEALDSIENAIASKTVIPDIELKRLGFRFECAQLNRVAFIKIAASFGKNSDWILLYFLSLVLRQLMTKNAAKHKRSELLRRLEIARRRRYFRLVLWTVNLDFAFVPKGIDLDRIAFVAAAYFEHGDDSAAKEIQTLNQIILHSLPFDMGELLPLSMTSNLKKTKPLSIKRLAEILTLGRNSLAKKIRSNELRSEKVSERRVSLFLNPSTLTKVQCANLFDQ